MSNDVVKVDTRLEPDTEHSILNRSIEYGITMPQMLFVMDYIIDFEPGRPYTLHIDSDIPDTGVARHLGKAMLARPEVARAVAAEVTRVGNHLNITRETLIARVWAEALDTRSKAAERLKALELLGKMIGATEFDPNAGKDNGPKLTVIVNDPRNVMVKSEDKNGKVDVIDATLGPNDTVEITSS